MVETSSNSREGAKSRLYASPSPNYFFLKKLFWRSLLVLILSYVSAWWLIVVRASKVVVLVAGIAFVCSVFGVVVSNLIILFWRCPNCGKAIHTNWQLMYGNPFSKKCLNCDLPIRREFDDD